MAQERARVPPRVEPVEAGRPRTTTRASQEAADVRAVAALRRWTTAHQRTRSASARLSTAPTGPATAEIFSVRGSEQNGNPSTPLISRWRWRWQVRRSRLLSRTPKALLGRRACGRGGQPRTGEIGSSEARLSEGCGQP